MCSSSVCLWVTIAIATCAVIVDSAPFTFFLLFDDFAHEIFVEIRSVEQNTLILSDGSFDSAEWREDRLYTAELDLVEGEEYRLSVLDEFGDGLTTGAGYGVAYGSGISDDPNDIIFLVQNFTDRSDVVYFVAKRRATPSPSVSPFPTKSPVPTTKPTPCRHPDDWELLSPLIEPEELTPKFETAQSVWPDTNRFCTQHTSYQDCVSEFREDCQFIFRSASRANGICRVDPVAACIRNGNCVCNTRDFGGGSELGQGILAHFPISITSGDISPDKDKVTFYETWTPPENDHPRHRQRDDFFISRVDFTGRKLFYTFAPGSQVIATSAPKTVSFKIHYIYMDVPIEGRILAGQGLVVDISTSGSNDVLKINGQSYSLPNRLKMWTCTSITITNNHVYVGTTKLARQLGEEYTPPPTNKLELGEFSGELFDVRIYKGTLGAGEVANVGRRCAGPDDPHSMHMMEQVESPFLFRGCDLDTYSLHAGMGGPQPTDGRYTYGSGAFATLWNRPVQSFTGEYFDRAEGTFDEERFFQHAKIQSYLWERFYFEYDLIAFNQKPYRWFNSSDEVPQVSEKFWNNPCYYMHDHNNGWQYPIYGGNTGLDDGIEKWEVEKHGNGDPQAVFDIYDIYSTEAFLPLMDYFSHEGYHAFQGTFWDTYGTDQSQWFVESTAEFGFVAPFNVKKALVVAAHSATTPYPLNMQEGWEYESRGPYFYTDKLSVESRVRGGNLYGSWILWWFLAEHAGLPHIPAMFITQSTKYRWYFTGEMTILRAMLESHNLDLGDVWATHVAHMRTWDFLYGQMFADREEEDWAGFDPPVETDETMEERKTSAVIHPVRGTNGAFVAGPEALRPGPFGWNCLTMYSVKSGSTVSIQIVWDDGMGFYADPNDTNNPNLPDQQAGCDDDPRFYQTVVVVLNLNTDERSYWKLKGKSPSTLHLSVGSNGPVNVHIMLIPTPPTDYVGSHFVTPTGELLGYSHIPIYSYSYKVAINEHNGVTTPPNEEAHGIIKFDNGSGWWPVECTCIFSGLPEVPSDCFEPVIEKVGFKNGNTPSPSTTSPASASPSAGDNIFGDASSAPSIFSPTFNPTFSGAPLPGPPLSTAAPSSEPTVSATPLSSRTCVDDESGSFTYEHNKRDCAWLRSNYGRNSRISACRQGAARVCPYTCGDLAYVLVPVGIDCFLGCKDDPDYVFGEANRTCEWLFRTKHPNNLEEYCEPEGSDNPSGQNQMFCPRACFACKEHQIPEEPPTAEPPTEPFAEQPTPITSYSVMLLPLGQVLLSFIMTLALGW
eukprot:CAMPEP_0194045284 /NCGR_PEP_ID=MMETSP0009_2-20130614/16644_1 /TAXON_ID=210454 /ORGANISM="Grammatophora oceanica, Strain CCMP 410" /LENGTH=1281 /DNA_ID=CAMNT_0038690103 /DNA_START=137 /DNA_END=3979 /DNA_ORIENTATION=+